MGDNNNDIYDPVNCPSHYCEGRKYEPINVINDWDLGFNLGNAVKYISRAGRKGGSQKAVEDLKKARYYLNYEIERLEFDMDYKEGNTEE